MKIIKKTNKDHKISIRLTDEMYLLIKKYNLSISEVCRVALLEQIAMIKKKK